MYVYLHNAYTYISMYQCTVLCMPLPVFVSSPNENSSEAPDLGPRHRVHVRPVVCMYVYMYVCMYAYMYVCMWTRVRIRLVSLSVHL